MRVLRVEGAPASAENRVGVLQYCLANLKLEDIRQGWCLENLLITKLSRLIGKLQ